MNSHEHKHSNEISADLQRESTRKNITARRSEVTKTLLPKNSPTCAEEVLQNFQKKTWAGAYLKNGQYRLDKKIDQGGMGEIFQGFDTVNMCEVAVKHILFTGNVNKEEMIKRFKQEYIFLSQITHPHVVRVYDFLEESGEYFLIMEWVTGISLKKILESQTICLTLPDQIAIAHQISSAVELLNTLGILHRDIKPGNIIVNLQNKKAVLLDLGLAKSIDNETHGLTVTGTILGTPEYLSPEQVNGSISPYSDIFSLGITLYQFFLWQAKSPFYSERFIETMNKILTHNLPLLYDRINRPLSPLEQKVYLHLSSVLAKCLAKEQHERLSSASMLRKELEKIHRLFQQIQTNDYTCWRLSNQLSSEQRKKLEILSQQYGKEKVFQNRKTRRKSHRRSKIPWFRKIGYFVLLFLIGILIRIVWNDDSVSEDTSITEIPVTQQDIQNTILPPQENYLPKEKQTIPTQHNSNEKNTDISDRELLETIQKLKTSVDQLDKNRLYKQSYPLKLQVFQLSRTFYSNQIQALKQKLSVAKQREADIPIWQLELMIKKYQSELKNISIKEKSLLMEQLAEEQRDKIHVELYELYLQPEESNFEAMRCLHNIQNQSKEQILNIISIAQMLSSYTYQLYYLKKYCKLFPDDKNTNIFKTEISKIWQSLEREEIEDSRKCIRKLFFFLGYLYVADWDIINDLECQAIWKELLSIQETIPDIKPFIQCLQCLLLIRENKEEQAQIELKKIKIPEQFPHPFLSLYLNQYLWPELQFIQGIIYSKQGKNNLAIPYMNWIQKNCVNYPGGQGNILGNQIATYSTFDYKNWHKQINMHLKEISKIFFYRAVVSNEELLRTNVQKNVLRVIKNYQDIAWFGHEVHIAFFKAGVYAFALKNYEEAEKNILLASKMTNRFSETHFYLGEICMELKRYEEARDKFRYCVVFQPIWSPEMLNKSWDYLKILPK